MNYEEIAQNLQEYYANTLIVQYHGKRKASATIKLLVDLLFQKAMLLQIRDAFDWKTAAGVQLDIIGKWVGVDRIYNFNILTGNKLAYPQYSRVTADNYDASQGGYSDYYTFDYDADILTTDAYIIEGEEKYSETWLSDTDGGTPLTPTIGTFYKVKTEGDFENKVYCWNNGHYELYWAGGILTYADLESVNNSLSDDKFRIIVGLKIIYNSIQNTASNIDNAIWNYFDGKVYTTWDVDNMELTYNYPQAELEDIMQIAYNKGVLPAPVGTRILLGGY